MSESDVSESTIVTFLLATVMEALERGAIEAIQSKDYLTYSTLLDIYLGDPTRFTIPEREELLGHLLTILNNHKELTYEIGWDLPSLLIAYVKSDFTFNGPLRDAPCVVKILKCFEVLAHYGNPKELFLKCCEVMASLQIQDENDDAEEVESEEVDTDSTESGQYHTNSREEIDEKFFDIKLYCIFELIDSCLKKIKTVYPSRFLSMTITSFINLVYANRDSRDLEFMTKRAYSFTKNYSSPGFPENHGFSDEELAKIKDDEDYLQRKLLTGFVSHVYYITTANYLTGYTHEYLNYIAGPGAQDRPGIIGSLGEHTHLDSRICDRMVGLAESLDIPLSDNFKKFVTDSHALLDSFDYTKDEDELSGEIFEKAVINFQQTLGGSIVDSDGKSINDSLQGFLLFYTHLVVTKKDFEVSVTFKDALVLTLRLLIPAMVNERFSTRAMKDLCLYWMWHALHLLQVDSKKIELEVASIPKVLLTIYCHLLLFICQDRYLRYIGLTTLTKVLTFVPEDISYEFFKDSLHSVPFESNKALLVGVLKELLTKERNQNVDELELKLSKVSLEEPGKEAPSLPARNTTPRSKYLNLTEVRFDDILELIQKSNEETFVKQDEVTVIDPSKLSTLLAYLNLIVVLKSFPVVVKGRDGLDKTLSEVKANIEEIKKKHNPEKNNSLELNAAGMLELTLDRIGN
ncbi:DUF1760-domain-containing protein [Suhomyces tanzawaensis NRRL Y-17324]|uniref:DUF1760-domain-containing protein n=1 Tax=Suhomyces tanzawaensis NRRL Y-17324 TaxID=984487 RepID=A0A1E4SFK0_9ASCO|nr:DUF1760-domain-containing protein [Suhomyces tanzawaensis NRRL Y-17324]ODV78299.1 DUF1760-domain-containing protein [Suhomyces tanzawaensis NRRL Y-17324]